MDIKTITLQARGFQFATEEGIIRDWNNGVILPKDWHGECLVFFSNGSETGLFETGIDEDNGERYWNYINK